MRLINKKWSTKRNENKILQTAFKDTFFLRKRTDVQTVPAIGQVVIYWPLEQDILSIVPHSFDELLVYIQKSIGFILLRSNWKRSHLTWNWAYLAPKNNVDFKCTNLNVRTFYFRHKSVNQVFAFLTSVTHWWWQTCYEIKHMKNDIKTSNICEYSDTICSQSISSSLYLATNALSWNYEEDLAM